MHNLVALKLKARRCPGVYRIARLDFLYHANVAVPYSVTLTSRSEKDPLFVASDMWQSSTQKKPRQFKSDRYLKRSIYVFT